MGAALDRGQICGARYRIEALLGEGGMATVYRAVHTETDRVVALKVVRQEFAADKEVREMFVREARVCSRIGRSDHIVDVLDAGIDETLKTPFMAMELLDGEPLDAWIRTRGAVSVEDTLRLVEQLAEGLDQAHQAGVFHRDLKPQNLFLCKSKRGLPTLKILDFGIAKLSETAQQSSTHVGTPAYSAPEQLGPSWRTIAEQRGKTIASVVSASTDIWAMGLVVYEMLTGSTSGDLWGATTLAELPVKIVLEPLPVASKRASELKRELPPGFDAWLARCLDLDATKRFGSAREAWLALSAALSRSDASPLAVQKTMPDDRPASPAAAVVREPTNPGSFAPAARMQSSPSIDPHAPSWPPAQPAQPSVTGMPRTQSSPSGFGLPSSQPTHTPQPPSPQPVGQPQQGPQPPHASHPHAQGPHGAPPHGAHAHPAGVGFGPHGQPFDPNLTAWAAHRRAELRVPDPRTYFATGPLQFLGRITGAFREARLTVHDAELVLVDVTLDDGIRSLTGEGRHVLAMVTSPRLRYRAALRSKRMTGVADSVAKGVKFLDDLVNPALVFSIGDAFLEQRFELAGPTREEAHHALTLPLRQLLVNGGFGGSLELRQAGLILTRDDLTRFDAWSLDQLVDTVARVYGAAAM